MNMPRYVRILSLAVVLLCPGAVMPPSSGAAPLSVPGSVPSEPGQAELQTLLNDIGRQRLQVIEIQRELVRRPALNPEDGGEGEEAKARWIEGWLREKGLPHAVRIDSPDERVPSKVRPNLIIRYPGASTKTLWLIGHLDVSHPGPLEFWPGDPWVLRVEGDKLHGRGVEDNHQLITSGLILMEALHRNKATPPVSLGIILSAAEKIPSSPHGMQSVLALHPELLRADDLIIVNDYGNDQGTLVELAEKGLLWLSIKVTGKPGHSSKPDTSINALDAAAAFIMDLRGLKNSFPANDPLFSPPVSTFVPTKGEGEHSPANMIQGYFSFSLDCRILPPTTTGEVYEEVEALAKKAQQRDGAAITVTRSFESSGAAGTSPDAPVVHALRRAIRAQLKQDIELAGVGGVTQASTLRVRGLPVAVWARDGSRGIAPNEHASVAKQLEAAQVFARILFDPEAARAVAAKEEAP